MENWPPSKIQTYPTWVVVVAPFVPWVIILLVAALGGTIDGSVK